MRVLMLGWEFPPLVTGGLGTACRGITEGLARLGVDVLFVVPRSGGGVESRHGARVVGCDALAGAPAPSAPPPVLPPVPPPPLPPLLPKGSGRLAVLGIPSPLRPYPGATDHAAPAAGLSGEPGDPDLPGELPDVADRAGEGAEPGFDGGYGPNLFAEVERYAEVVAELARDEAFDLVHAHDWMTFPAAARVRAGSGRPLVCHVHACERDRAGEAADPRILATEEQGLAAADRIVCVSRFTAGRVRESYGVDPARLRVVHNGAPALDEVARRGLPSRPPGQPPTVLSLGRVTAQKAPATFLEAARLVLERAPATRFLVAGTGDLLPAMVERAAELSIGGSVSFTGYLDERRFEEAFARADLFVLTSLSEPFGLTPLEALLRDVPVIVTRQSGVAEVLASCPKYDYWNVEELADKILTLVTSPSLRRQLAAAGRLELGKTTWERRAGELLELYRELV